jgi:predicted DNA-binding transcriptional regulator AlpA
MSSTVTQNVAPSDALFATPPPNASDLSPLRFNPSTPQLVSIDTICTLIGINRRTLYRWLLLFPDFPRPIRFGRLIRFRLHEVNQWIDARGVVR